METIGSKRSYALTWCMPNNDDDDDDDISNEFVHLINKAGHRRVTSYAAKYLTTILTE